VPSTLAPALSGRVASLSGHGKALTFDSAQKQFINAGSAAPLDADIDALWSRINTEYHANQRAIVQSINDKGALREELDVQTATDILWTINHPNTWQLLVRQRGWTPDEYEQWAAETACAQLLDPNRGRRSPATKRSG